MINYELKKDDSSLPIIKPISPNNKIKNYDNKQNLGVPLSACINFYKNSHSVKM